ncbi:MAG: hypothetical protein HY015_00350 [Bacteroidetes bacterium]|nr:hypothetical protein [Bacteroidota bacterium]MBI3481428.1 hypothetical protein [Bacteroidota bacterium]
MKNIVVKFKDLIVSWGTSLFAAISLTLFIFGAIFFSIFSITLASIFEAKTRVSAFIWKIKGHGLSGREVYR